MDEQPSEGELLDDAMSVLRRRLPSTWLVEKAALGGETEPRDLLLRSPNASWQTVILVESRPNVSPRDVHVLMGGPWRRWRRQAGNQAILLVAPYIGPKVRELLIEEGVNYLDLTGNIRIDIDQPGVFIEMVGAQQDPGATKPRRGLRGAKVGAVVRVLVEACPPYTGAEIARAADVNEGYTSRILETLNEAGLIEREAFGPVTAVDWPGLVRRRAQALDLFRPANTFRFVSRQGTRSVLQALAQQSFEPVPTVTGSFAASRLAPVAAPTLLVIYTMAPRELANSLSLLPAETGADTILVRPDNRVVFARPEKDDGLLWAAPSQVAIDCLAGSGRMPAEGEAVIDWMREHEDRWRQRTITALIEAQSSATGGKRA